MKAFKVTGTFLMGNKWQNFTKEVAAGDKGAATELVFSLIGSKHRVKRPKINIDKITPIKPEDITDTVVTYKVAGGGE